jgi:hypothetical protein
MAFVLCKEQPDRDQPGYIKVLRGFENLVNQSAVTYEQDIARATRFNSREAAERWQAVLSRGSGTVELVEVE